MNKNLIPHTKRMLSPALVFLAAGLSVFIWLYGVPTFLSIASMPERVPAVSITEDLKIAPSDGHANDKFGNAIAQDGNTLVIGSVENNEGGVDSGAVYIYEQLNTEPMSWTLSLKLVVSDSVGLANFGASIALEDDLLVVSAPNDLGEVGSVYIFDRNLGGANEWGQVAKISPENGEAGDYFGVAVVLQGDILVVGADGDDEQAMDAGAAYIFDRNQGGSDQWGLVKKIFSEQTDHGDHFGSSLALDGDTLIVGAPFDDIVGINRTGRAVIFQRDQNGFNQWGEVKIIQASDAAAEDFFGTSVTISGDFVAVGAVGKDTVGSESGAVYVFFRNEGDFDAWGEVKKILASDPGGGQRFGGAVALSGQLLLVGKPEDGTSQTGNGDAYLFNYVLGGIGNWGEVAHLIASDSENLDGFGGDVALNAKTLFVGARLTNDHGDNSGSVYVFDLPTSATVNFLPLIVH